MGQDCKSCCTGEDANEFRASTYQPNSLYIQQSDRKQYPDQVSLAGNSYTPSRIYSAAEIRKIVLIQSYARRFMAMRLYNRLRVHSNKYLSAADYSS